MDNYFKECPPMMNDGRLFTDYRASQVREELFRYKNSIISENEARMLRTNNAETIMDTEWQHLRENSSCFAQKRCFHKSPTTLVSSIYNNTETHAYNGLLQAPTCDTGHMDYRLTQTRGSIRNNSKQQSDINYPKNRHPIRNYKTNKIHPDGLRY